MTYIKLTNEQRAAILLYIQNHTYTGESHRTDQGSNVEWLRADELNKYLPNAIELIINNRRP